MVQCENINILYSNNLREKPFHKLWKTKHRSVINESQITAVWIWLKWYEYQEVVPTGTLMTSMFLLGLSRATLLWFPFSCEHQSENRNYRRWKKGRRWHILFMSEYTLYYLSYTRLLYYFYTTDQTTVYIGQ